MMRNIVFLFTIALLTGCINSDKIPDTRRPSVSTNNAVDTKVEAKPIEITVTDDVALRFYFEWMDRIVEEHNDAHNYDIDEYVIVHHNKWIIDTLANTDYYYLMDQGIFNKDSQSLTVLKEGQILIIPDSLTTVEIKNRLSKTHLELNIPEFRLRIFQDEKELFKFPVRVGKVGSKYMAMANTNVDMRTQTGVGEIIRVNKNPVLANPVTNRKYKMTNRDDGKSTTLPIIPWLEPSLDGRSVGQLIHPTTNLETLNKASSNGCIGLREAHAWIVYYYAPLGTKVISKYELQGLNNEGDVVFYKNIYPDFIETQ